MTTNLFLVVLLIVLLVYIWWNLFFKNDRFKERAFPSEWRKILEQKVRFYQNLSKEDRHRFEQDVLELLDDITITGVETSVSDTDKMLVASSGVIPLFGFPNWKYRNLNEVLLYEGTFNHDYQTKGKGRNILGMVGEGAMQRMMILSKSALHQGFENTYSKNNVGIHEFVHLLDKADGDTDGIPEVFIEQQYLIPWVTEMHQEIKDIKTHKSNINPYGATNQAEFLSVVSEYFFNQPRRLAKDHPELFELLEEIYKQDLA